MLFQKKIDRAQKWLKEQSGGESPEECGEKTDLPDMETLKAEAKEEIHLEKGDIPALLLAAFPIVIICTLVLLALCSFVFFL